MKFSLPWPSLLMMALLSVLPSVHSMYILVKTNSDNEHPVTGGKGKFYFVKSFGNGKKSLFWKQYVFLSFQKGRALGSGLGVATGAIFKGIGTGLSIKRGSDRVNNPNAAGILSKNSIGCKGTGCWNVGFGVKSPNLVDKFFGGIQSVLKPKETNTNTFNKPKRVWNKPKRNNSNIFRG